MTQNSPQNDKEVKISSGQAAKGAPNKSTTNERFDPDNVLRTQAEACGYRLVKKLGRGSYRTVWSAFCKASKTFVALKVSDLGETGPTDPARRAEEVRLWSGMNHHSVIKLFLAWQTTRFAFMSMPIADFGDLEEYVRISGPLDDVSAKPISKDILSSLAYLHSRLIAHRDVKSSNVVLKGHSVINMRTQIIDFSLSMQCSSEEELSRHFVGTRNYMPPEMLRHCLNMPFKADVFSTGLVLHFTMAGRLPFSAASRSCLDDKMVKKVEATDAKSYIEAREDVELDCQLSTDARDLLARMMSNVPVRRPTAQAARMSKWLAA